MSRSPGDRHVAPVTAEDGLVPFHLALVDPVHRPCGYDDGDKRDQDLATRSTSPRSSEQPLHKTWPVRRSPGRSLVAVNQDVQKRLGCLCLSPGCSVAVASAFAQTEAEATVTERPTGFSSESRGRSPPQVQAAAVCKPSDGAPQGPGTGLPAARR